jgi:hypothetical protein
MSAVLITVLNGSKVLDAGTGIVLGQAPNDSKTYVLTCAHTLRAIGRRVVDKKDNPVRIVVNGTEAVDVGDVALARFDLSVLIVNGMLGKPSRLKIPSASAARVSCEGFINFFQHQYARSQVKGMVEKRIETLMPDGAALTYLEIRPKRSATRFAKGLSGAPVYDAKKNVIGVARILDESTERVPLGYAIQISQDVLTLLEEIVPCDLQGAPSNLDRPPPPPTPLPESVRDDDIQRGRWGGTNTRFGRTLTIENLHEYRSYFLFDAVLEADDGKPLVGPFVFHLHDTFARSVIWIRKTQGRRAALEEIYATGTFTFGVQFKDGNGTWQSLEFDLATYDRGRLKKKYD